jgi:hypothetical protein
VTYTMAVHMGSGGRTRIIGTANHLGDDEYRAKTLQARSDVEVKAELVDGSQSTRKHLALVTHKTKDFNEPKTASSDHSSAAHEDGLTVMSLLRAIAIHLPYVRSASYRRAIPARSAAHHESAGRTRRDCG